MLEVRDFSKGMLVQLITSTPVHGLGAAKKGDIGIIIEVNPNVRFGPSMGNIKVCYPSQSSWNAKPRDLKILRPHTEISLGMCVKAVYMRRTHMHKDDIYIIEGISPTGLASAKNIETGRTIQLHHIYFYKVDFDKKDAVKNLISLDTI